MPSKLFTSGGPVYRNMRDSKSTVRKNIFNEELECIKVVVAKHNQIPKVIFILGHDI